jgi:CRP/FNR family cyclic AMP-dependent transcriptional regulator
MALVPPAGDLAAMPLFQGLEPEDLARLHGQLKATTFPPGTTVMTTEQPGEVVYVVLNGTLKIYVEQASGSTVILAILGAGEVVGEMSMLDKPVRSATALTMEESTLLWLDRATFSRCLRTMPPLAVNLVTIMSRRLRLANEQIQALAALDVYGRVARQLLAFAQVYGASAAGGDVVIPLRLTQTDLADLVGASRVRVNQVLVAFRESRHISVDHQQRITIHHPEALAEFCA